MLSNYATTVSHDGQYTVVTYHATKIVSFNRDEIILNTGGYATVTTKKKMNQASVQMGLEYHVFQKDYQWFVDYRGAVIEFNDNVLVLAR